MPLWIFSLVKITFLVTTGRGRAASSMPSALHSLVLISFPGKLLEPLSALTTSSTSRAVERKFGSILCSTTPPTPLNELCRGGV